MKLTRRVTNCEYCDKQLGFISPPSEAQYEQGLIYIEKGSIVLLSKAIVEWNHKAEISDDHAENLDGYYCDWHCLVGRIEEIVGWEKG